MKSPPLTEQRIILPKVSWPEFEKILREMEEGRTMRLAYWRGKLEMMTPTEAHDRCRRLIESLLWVLVEEQQRTMLAFGSQMLKRPDLDCGLEPDGSYYIQQQEWVKDRGTVDLMQDPPPDLLVEVEISKSTLPKLPICALLGIPEVWRYITTVGEDTLKGKLVIYELQGSQYQEVDRSPTFPFLRSSRVVEFLEQSDSLGLQKALIVLRDWVRQQ